MNASVIVTTYNRPDDLTECLDSLNRQFVPPDEVIVVDDGDTHVTARAIELAGINDIRHIEGSGDGLPAARNTGASAATGDIVCFVDDDVILPPNWLREILATYEKHDDVSGVGGLVLNYNPADINKANVESFSYRLLTSFRLTFLYDKLGYVSPVGILYAPHIFMTVGYRRVETLQGCNMSFRQGIFDGQLFDEWYGSAGSSACEEIDFCVRLASEGHELIYNPRAAVLHKRSPASRSRDSEPNYDNITNLTYFILSNPKLSYLNLLPFIGAIVVYAVLKQELKYLKAIAKGIRQYVDRS